MQQREMEVTAREREGHTRQRDRMHVGLRACPGRRIHGHSLGPRVEIFPLRAHSDGVLSVHSNLLLRDAGGAQGRDPDGASKGLNCPLVNVNVMRIEVVADVAAFAGP